jgi:hypothetical protein
LLLGCLLLTGFGCAVDQLVGSLATQDSGGDDRDGGDSDDDGGGGNEDVVNSLAWGSDAGPNICRPGWTVAVDCASTCGAESCELVCTGAGGCCAHCGTR